MLLSGPRGLRYDARATNIAPSATQARYSLPTWKISHASWRVSHQYCVERNIRSSRDMIITQTEQIPVRRHLLRLLKVI